MATRPHDVTDLYLAPVLLAVDARIEELGHLDKDQLAHKVAFQSDAQDHTPRMREEALIETITSLIDCHGWELSWDPRGLRLTHDVHTFVLGVPGGFREYIAGEPESVTHARPGRGPQRRWDPETKAARTRSRGRRGRGKRGAGDAVTRETRRRLRASAAAWQLGVRHALVHARLPGQAEDALADDVALDLVGPAGQPVARRAEDMLGPREAIRLAGVGGDPRSEQGGGQLADAHQVLRGDQLADRRGGPRRSAGGGRAGDAFGRGGPQLRPHVDVGQLLADDRVTRLAEPGASRSRSSNVPPLRRCA